MIPRLIEDPRPSPADTGWDSSWWPTGRSSLPLELVGWAFLLIGILVLCWGAWRYARWSWQRTEPLRLYLRVTEELQLTRAQAWWLFRVARHQGLASPITLLLSPNTHDHHVQMFLHDRPGPEGTTPRPLAAAREQLFGPPNPPDAPPN